MVEETQIPSTTTEEAMDVIEADGTGTEVNTSPSIPGDLRVGSLTSKLRGDHPKVLVPLQNFLWLLIWVVGGNLMLIYL